MKITEIRSFLVDRYLLIRVYTDAGIIGNGEAGLWAHHGVVKAALDELSDYYLGQDPRRIEHHFQVVSRQTHFAGAVLSAALSAIDIALWDILGKSVDLPVYQLLGGKCRDKVKVFDNVVGETLPERVASARGHVAAGYTSLRMTPFYSGFEQKPASQVIDEAVAMVSGVREGIGYGIDLGLEIHRNLRIEEAITLARELEPYRILYYEDPLAPESVEGLEIMARSVRLPVATGERFYSIQQFKDLIDSKLVCLIRPDVSLVGGFTQIKKIAAIAESAFVGIFPHLMGSAVNNAAFTHFAAAIPNYVLMESNAAGAAVVDKPMPIREGCRIVSDRPGIGVEIDEELIAQYVYKPVPITGHFHADGSVAY